MGKQTAISRKSGAGVNVSRRNRLLLIVVVTLAVVGLVAWRLKGAGRFGVTTMPKVKVSAWVNQAKPVATPDKVKVYSYARSDSGFEARRLAKQLLGVTELETKDNYLIGYSQGKATDNSDVSALVYNTKDQTFSYDGVKGYKLGTAGSVESKADKFLQLLISDQTLKATATYKRTDKPGVTFVEFHRDWDVIGSPILNELGLLNMRENERLASVSLVGQSGREPDNKVYSTSDQSDGLGRRADFNTALVGINESSGSVVSVTSNLRQLSSGSNDGGKVMAYDTAVGKLMKNDYAFLNTTPEGAGVPEFNKVYPNNMAEAKTATITDSRMVYLERLPGVAQSQLEPYYVFRGSAVLDSGYTVRFVAGVAATEKPLISNLLGWIKGSSAWAEGGSGATSAPVIDPPAPPVGPPPPPPIGVVTCAPAPETLINSQRVSDGLFVGQLTQRGLDQINKAGAYAGQIIAVGDWYIYSTSRRLRAEDVDAALTVVKADFWNRKNRALSELSTNPDCPVRITGMSPTIFVYGAAGSSVTVTPGSKVTYSDPGLDGGSWKVELGDDSMTVNGLIRPYIYYEYQPVQFARPKAGWKVPKLGLSSLAASISAQLKLNGAESDRLLFELRNAASSIGQDDLFVGPLDGAEVAAKLPLSVSGGSALTRLQFYVGKAGSDGYAQPVLTPVQRTQSMVLELGASAQR